MKDKMDDKIEILNLKEQCARMDSWLEYRLKSILPELMSRENMDMWVVLAREYNEDPIFLTLVPALERTASRLSCLAFYMDDNKKLHCLSFCRPNLSLEKYYDRIWDGKSETQWECLKRIIHERKPKSIGINSSKSFALADGLTKTLYEEFINAIGKEYKGAIVSAEKLSIGWLERRSPMELLAYKEIYKVAEEIINKAFSNNVIKPGVTTTSDVEWWVMEEIKDLGLKAWFTPTIDLQRMGAENNRIGDALILSGDILHCDIGIEYMGLCTDTQRIAYVLKEGEKEAPVGLCNALSNCNKFQDIVAKNYIEERTGNQILSASLEEAKSQDIKAMCYTHPIGYHGHGAGPFIGLWDNQTSIPIKGDYPVYSDTCYALELNASTKVPDWDDQEVTIFLEETVTFTKGNLEYIGKRQKEFILI